MDATTLKAALIRAGVTQEELAARLHRRRGTISGWVAANRVPEEYEELVCEALGLPAPVPPPAIYSDDELLSEIRRRLGYAAGPRGNDLAVDATNRARTGNTSDGNTRPPAQAHPAKGPQV